MVRNRYLPRLLKRPKRLRFVGDTKKVSEMIKNWIENAVSSLGGQTKTPDELSPDVSYAGLLVRVARADHEYAAEERALILELLAARFSLDAQSAAQLLDEGEAAERGSNDTVQLTRGVKDLVPLEERGGLLEEMWQIVLTDETRDEDENAVMRLVTNLLGVPDRESAFARQRAQAR